MTSNLSSRKKLNIVERSLRVFQNSIVRKSNLFSTMFKVIEFGNITIHGMRE